MSAVRRSGFMGRRVVERLCEATRTQVITERWSFEATESSRRRGNIEDSRTGLDSSDFHFDLRTFYLHPRYSREDGHLQRIAVAEQETTTNCKQRTCGGIDMWLLMSGREEDEVSSSRRDGEQYAKIEEGRGWPEQRSRTQCIRGDVDSDTEPERSFLSSVFMTIYSQIYRSKVLDRVEAQSLISEGKEDGASSRAECEDQVTKLRKENYEVQVPRLAIIQTLSTASYRYHSTKEKAVDRDGRPEAVHRLLPPRLHPSNCEVEGQHSRSKEVSACTHRGRKPIFEAGSRVYRAKVTGFIRARTYATLKYLVSSREKVVNEDGRLKVAQRHLEQGLRPPDEIPDEV
ncbi:hypothetical protein BKA82DRAFT_4457719 [Pisolithus tinctorius]|nr:hypothetical protein BKA82DRAFT_4457719 [Pisolithus tinctorius]